MSDCGCSRRCTCAVTAGPGVTVDGSGSPSNPYVISSSAAATPTPVQAVDTPSVDTTVTGTGTAGDPYVVGAAVVLDPAPPGGGSNLVHSGPGGVYVECADVRSCLSAGDGIAYDSATGEIDVRPSTDAGNQVTIGTDGGVYAPPPGAASPTVVQAQDTPTVDTTVSGSGTAGAPYLVSSAVRLDPTPPQGGTNLIGSGAEGLFLECADVRSCLSAGDGIAYDPATGEIAARPSTDAGNAVVFGADGGIYAPAAGGAAVTTACGLTGDGSGTDPLAAVVGTWGYPCDLDANAGQVYCDSTGQLRSEPRPVATFNQFLQNTSYPATPVPVPTDTVVDSRPFTITNPDPCRAAFVMCEVELDVDLTLPPGAAAEYGINGDDQTYMKNSGTTTQALVHAQSSKVFNVQIPPGGTSVQTFDVTMGDAIGSPTYSRIQTAFRAFIFNL